MKKKDRIKLREQERVQKPIIQKPLPKWMDKIGVGCGIFIIICILSFSCGMFPYYTLKDSCYKCDHRFDNYDFTHNDYEEWRKLINEQMECERTHTFVGIKG
jgi:hypothetical protein